MRIEPTPRCNALQRDERIVAFEHLNHCVALQRQRCSHRYASCAAADDPNPSMRADVMLNVQCMCQRQCTNLLRIKGYSSVIGTYNIG